jgi:hypothetical protein
MMAASASFASVVYLGFGLVLEVIRRNTGWRVAERVSLGLDRLPAQALESCGLMRALRALYADGQLSEFWVRVVFGVTTVVIIFLIALGVGLFMWPLRLLMRSEVRSAPPP